jgi:peptidoglycan/xylan/chitin deacetylase (PgdA/CDA1 family)
MTSSVCRQLRTVLLPVCLSLLAACAGSGGGPLTRDDLDIVASDDAFAIVRLEAGQRVEDIARVLIGSESDAWQIREVNGAADPGASGLLAVPLRPVNPTGIYRDRYRVIPILCYHQFTRGEPAHRLELRARDFEAQLRYMRDEGFRFLSFAEVADIMRRGEPMPDRSVVLTIDDGYGSVYDIAWPLLKKYGAKATLFVYTDFVGGGDAMTWDELRELDSSSLIEVESHGKSHTSLARTRDDNDMDIYRLRLAEELSGSESAFMAQLGHAPRFLSYPYGNSSREIATMLADAGYELAATVTRGPNASFVDPFLLHRTMIYADHDIDDLEAFLRTSRRP